ncbi:hypothetical protein [Streptomyces sp. DH37]|uniref:hypothetical protein n=1 Tax=Streptomyces sp. DH37 TaxID=3040122 RepID=UPI0024432C83|nr:hypothetical protein [Streptomyces sp. DH37]MDG9704015.1 hypothetical protein [Streptomyces sp. DH37]
MPEREPAPAAGRAERRSVPALCLCAVLLVLLLPALVLYGQDVRPGAALAVQCVVVAHTGGALARVLTDPLVRVVGFGFWLFCYVWLGLAPLAMLATDSYPWGFAVDAGAAFTSAVLVETGLLAYSAGAALAGRRPARTSAVLEPLLARRITPLRTLLLSGLALALAAVLVPAQGGLPAFFRSRQAVNEAASQGDPGGAADQALAAWSLSVPAFWALVALLFVPRAPGGDRTLRGARWILLPVLVAVNVVVNNPVSQPRFWAGTVLLTILFAAPALRRPRAFRAAAAAVTAAVLVVFPYSDYFRYEKREPVEVVSLAEQFTSNGDYDAFQQIATGVDYVRGHGHAPRDALGPPLFFVPRAVWPDKPDDAGILLARHAGYAFENLSAPLWIESYMWAGLPGVAAVFALFGAAGRRIDGVRHRLREHGGTFAALAVTAFGFYQIILLRGSLLFVMGPLTLLLLVPLLITGRPDRKAAPPAAPPPSAPPTRAAAAARVVPEPAGPAPAGAAPRTAPSTPSTGEART